MCGGHWIPEMVELAGGVNCFGDKQSGSLHLEWEEVVASQPEVIIVMPCGFNVAVQQQQVYVVDANAYTSRSGPRLVYGLEMFAQMLHPECFSGMIPAGGAARLSAEQLQAYSGV